MGKEGLKDIVFFMNDVHEHDESTNFYELPPEALREAIVNAVAHRDYRQHAYIQVSVSPDAANDQQIRKAGVEAPW